VPPPADYPSSLKVTGYWFLDDEPGWQPPPDLTAFLERGKPPVYIGFGSMTSGDARAKSNAVMSAILQSGQRAVVLRGWAGLADGAQTGKDVYFLQSAPHAWLFPRMAGVVHHGGAGTTAAAFRAGAPQFVIPHFADQPFWARRAHELGVSVKPVDKFKLNAASLADGITALVNTPSLRENAARLGNLIRAEDGVGAAVAEIEKFCQRS
jgi:sterol 3beta-glucosyltransferase